MKKIWLTIAGSLVIALAVNAQDRSADTTGTGSTQSTEYQYQWRDEDREQIHREDLPAGLIQTLEGTQYKGWENATIYRNKSSNDYMLVIQDNGQTRTFYFDKEGKERSLNTPGLNEEPADSSMDQNRPSGNTQDSTSMSGSSSSGSSSPSSDTQPGQPSSGVTNDNNDQGDNDQDDNEDQDTTSTAGVVSPTTVQDRPTSDLSTGSTNASRDADADTNDDDNNAATVNTSGQSASQPTGNDTNQPAQTSSATGNTTETGSTTSGDKSAWQSTDDTGAAEWSKEDRVVITTNDLPSSLLITLGDPMYKGWDNSTVYRNRKTNEYMIEIRDGSDTRTYYFDKNGKAIVRTASPDDLDD